MNRGDLSQTYRDAAGELDPSLLAVQKREQNAKEMDDNYARADEDMAEKTGRRGNGTAAVKKAVREIEENTKKENKEKVDRVLLLQAIDQRIAAFEADLERQYGEHFAENLFADLHEEGLIDPDEFARIMAIEDEDEKRRAIAAAIQDGIDSGRISPDDLKDHPWAREWLGMYRERVAAINREAELINSGQRQIHDASFDSQYTASSSDGPERSHEFDQSDNSQEDANQLDTNSPMSFNINGS